MRRLVALALFAVLCLIGAPGASAHSQLASSTPADGAVLDTAPAEVVFEFNEPLLPDFVRFIAADAAGSTSDLVVTGVDGATATVQWPAAFAPGEWRIEYRVVSQDGHPVNGGISFTYAGGEDSPTPTPTSPAPASSASPEPSTPEPTTSSPAASPSPQSLPATPASGSSAPNTGWIIAGVAVVALAVAAIVAVVIRRRTP